MKRITAMCVIALALFVVSSPSAQAGLIAWGFDWNASPSSVTAGSSSITLSNEPAHIAVGNSNTVATNLKVISSTDPNSGDTFALSGGKYSLTVDLVDNVTHATGSLTFNGQLQGTISQYNANVTNTFFSPTTQTITLGDTLFTVTLDSYTPPGPPSQGNLGSIGAYIQVGPKLHITSTPEPGSITLASFGVAVAGLGAWSRRRKFA
jgi:hypothetical protein